MLVYSALAQEAVAPATRNVTPPGMTPGPAADGPLVREPVPPLPPEPPRWRRYFLPVTTDAATFRVDDGKLAIRISGVTPPSLDESCTFADGTSWPCGRTALHQFRMFLRGRAIECLLPPPDGLDEVTAPCRVGQTDLGNWLLAQGWGRSNELSTEDYLLAASKARCSGIGIWRGAKPPAYCPQTDLEASAATPAPQVTAPAAASAPAAAATSEDDDRVRFTDDLFAE